MKKFIITLVSIAFYSSCSDSEVEPQSYPLAGIWQQIGMVNLEGGEFKDTVFWELKGWKDQKLNT